MIQSIFISSSGDLQSLRKGLHEDLHHWLDQHGFAHLLKPYLWEEDKEDGRLLSNRQRIQAQFPDPASLEVPLTICIFGERCGSPLEEEIDPLVIRRFDSWRAKGDGPGLLHPWPREPEAQDRALARGQYPLTGTVFELISAHSRPGEPDNLIVACCVDRPIMAETTADRVVLNGRKLHTRLTTGHSKAETDLIEAEIYDPQARALINLLKDHARRVIFVPSYPSEEAMRREVFGIAQEKLRQKLGIASLNNPFKQSLVHWAIDDEKRLPGRSGEISKLVSAMKNRGDLVLLTGRSGCGKSSLMQCGVMRRLREIDGSVPLAFRPTELMAGSGKGDALDKLARLIAETAGIQFLTGGPYAMRPGNYANQLRSALENNHINLVLGLDQFEEIIDELKLEKERGTGTPQAGWWLVIRFLKALSASLNIRLVATLESAREKSFQDLRLGEEIGLQPRTLNVDATEDTVAEIAKNGFARGGLPLDPQVIETIKRQWRAFERETPNDNASPLPLACLFFQRLYERFADQAGATAGERLESTFEQAGSHDQDRFLTLEEIGGEDEIAFAEIIQNLADEAWRAGGDDPEFSDPIETDNDFNGLNNFLKPLVTVDHDGQIQLRAVVESVADVPTSRQRKAFRERRLLVPVHGEELSVRPVHQALIDRWSPGRRWLDYRKRHLQLVQQFREDAIFWHRRGKQVPLEEDGSTLRAAAMTLYEYNMSWTQNRAGFETPDDIALRNQALLVFNTADDPDQIVENSTFSDTYAHLAATYHLVDLLRRFISTNRDCLKWENLRGDSLLHKAAWSDGPAVSFLIEQGVPTETENQQWSAIVPSISEKLNEVFDVMIDHVGLDDPIEPSSNSRMIHWAAAHGNLHVLEYLIQNGATICIRDDYKQTALHYTTRRDQPDAFRLLSPYVDILEQDTWKCTPISNAARFGAANVLSAYLSDEVDSDRLSAVLSHRDSRGDSPLMIAARNRQSEALLVLLHSDLGDLGDPSAPEHRSEQGDTLFHCVFRGNISDTPNDEDRFRARTAIEILLKDGRLDPNGPNEKGETPFDIAGAFPESRRVLRQDDRVPKDYDTMTPAMRIEDLSSRRPAIVLSLLKDAPQALTDRHEHLAESRNFAERLKDKKHPDEEQPASETGLDILIRLKNHAVLATLVEDPDHWPTLQQEFRKLLTVAEVPAAGRLRAALLQRFKKGEIQADNASEFMGVCIEADDVESARALAKKGVPLTLRHDENGASVLHRAAMSGDVERFRSVLDIGPVALPLDHWGRRPSDLAADALRDTFITMEAAMDDPSQKETATAVSSTKTGHPPYLALEWGAEVRPAHDTELAVLQKAWDEEWGEYNALDIRVFDLPFHPEVPLIELRPRAPAASSRLCFLLLEDKLFRLNGTSPPIHEVNAREKPILKKKTALQYLAFFCFFVRGEEGPFMIVDRPEHEFLPGFEDRKAEFDNVFRPPRVWGKNKRGHLLVSGLVYYSNALFFADFSLHPGGMVEMIDDKPVLADLPASVDAPLEIRTLH